MTTSTLAVPQTTESSPEEQEYRRRTVASERFFREARIYLPGGDSRSTLFYPPYPAVFARGAGDRVTDLDGNELLDFTGNHSALVHGYSHPEVLATVQRQLEFGTSFPGATEPQLRFARLLCQRIPSMALVRFTNSGTEATLNAIRAARAFTGRRVIARAEGAYHGSLEEFMVVAHPDVLTIPFNDSDAGTTIERHADSVAAVLIEPVQGSAGMIPASADYLRQLREVTSRHNILLVFDEVVSFRIAWGSAAEHFNITPDLTILGKLIGGGFPLGAFGGRADVMGLFDPSHGPPMLAHPGSYNANPMSLAAGAVTLGLLTRDAIARINQLGDFLRARMRETFAEAGVPTQITGLGSLFAIHLTPHTIQSRRDTEGVNTTLRHRLFLGLYNEGILIDPRGVGTISTALQPSAIDQFINRLVLVLKRLRAA